MNDKIFECRVFNPATDCPYTVKGQQDYVVKEATRHEVDEHGYEDTPELQQKIIDSLIDA